MNEAELVTKFQTMMDDTLKGLATKEELKKEVKETSAAYIAEHDADQTKALEEVRSENQKLQLSLRELTDKLALLRADRFSAIKDSDGNYRGIWGSAELARTLGLWVMSDILKIPAAQKSFDTLGIERRFITGTGEIVKAVESSDITEGASLAPSVVIPRLITLIETYSAYRQLAQEYPLGANDNSIPVQTGDPAVYCPGAGSAPTASDLSFAPKSLVPLEWAAYTLVNRDVDEDSAIPLGELVGRSLARAFGNKEDNCGFVGDGTSTYFNIIGAGAALRAVDGTIGNCKGLKVQDTPGAWDSIDIQDLLAVAGILPDYAEIEAGDEIAWVCSKAFYLTVIMNAAITLGGANAAEVTQPTFLTKPTFLGRPVKFGGGMPKTKPAADHCPLLYGNWKLGAALGDRRKFTVEISNEVKFLERQKAIMGTERIAINNFGVGDTTNAGPLVGFWADIA